MFAAPGHNPAVDTNPQANYPHISVWMKGAQGIMFEPYGAIEHNPRKGNKALSFKLG